MKRLMMTTALVAAAATGAYAQTQTQEETAAVEQSGNFLAERGPNDIHASEFIGMRVYSAEEPTESLVAEGIQDNWEDIGEINDVVLSRDGQIEAVLVDIGGFLGIGERQIAVDMDAVAFVADDATPENESDFFLVLNSDRAQLEGAPEYGWTEQSMNEAPAADDAMDGEDHAAVDLGADEPVNGSEMAEEESVDGSDVGDEVQADAGMSEEAPMAPVAEEPIGEESMAADEPVMEDTTIAPAGEDVAEAPVLGTEEGAAEDQKVAVDASEVASEQLTGARVYDLSEEHIGEISELLVDDSNNIARAVIDVGGFLGIGEKPVAIELSQLNIMRDNSNSEVEVHVNKTMDELKAMEEYKG